MPNHIHIRQSKKGRSNKHAYSHRIAYTETVRDDTHVLLFHAPFALVRDVCQKLFTMMQGNIGNIIIKNEHSCRVKNGKCYWRVAVEIIGLNESFISFNKFVLMLISCMKNLANCTIRHFRTETFLNL